MKGDLFWNNIMLFPLSKNKMASVENYLRIAINTEYVKYSYTEENQKKSIIHLLLFELLIQEIFHFLRRLVFLRKTEKEEITPPSSYNREENQTTKEENLYGEIGQRLIRYIFHIDKIIEISYESAKTFEALQLENEEEIELLKTILYKEHNSYAKLPVTIKSGIIHKIHDCRQYVSKFNC